MNNDRVPMTSMTEAIVTCEWGTGEDRVDIYTGYCRVARVYVKHSICYKAIDAWMRSKHIAEYKVTHQ